MVYRQEEATGLIQRFVRSYWMVDSQGETEIHREKIIPDGFPELIVHYKEPYRINLDGKWQLQSQKLIAGQISNHFYLENTGETGVFGIKLQPWSLKYLFNISMKNLRDKVIEMPDAIGEQIEPLLDIATAKIPFEEKTEQSDQWWRHLLAAKAYPEPAGEKAAKLILDTNGGVVIGDMLRMAQLSERGLERYFGNHIGLSPKFYSRIIRFAYIFKLVQRPGFQWADISYLAGFYDQSHFIKNFKEFTGEEPSRYAFEEANMANLFLR